MRLCLCLAFAPLLLLPVFCPAQGITPPSAAAQPAPADPFAQEPVVLRDVHIVLQWNLDGTGVRTESQSFHLQSDAAVRTFGVVNLLYASASQQAEFLAVRVHHPDGSVVETPLSDVQDETPPVTREAPFYSDIKDKQIPVRGLRVGDTLEWQTRIKVTRAEAPGQFWASLPFVRDVVTLNQTVEVRVPTSKTVNVWTNPANHITPQRSTEGAETVYRWQWKSLTPTVGKAADAAKKAKEGKLLTADEELDQQQGKLSDIALTTFPDWAAVGAWYRGLESDRMQPDDTIRAKVAEITAGKTSEQDKVRAVYDWVATNIRYIGVALGVGRYQPHTAGTVLQNQYGDCKDKHTLLASMLIALGQQPDAVLIGAGIRFNQAVPSPEAFNHLITRLNLDGKPVWLDSTAEVAPFRVLVPQIRDKEALVIPPTGAAQIDRTPAGYPFPPYSTMAIKGTLNKDLTSESDVTYTLDDDTGLGLRAGLRTLSPAQYGEGVQRVMQFLGFGGTTSDPVVENLSDLDKPLILRFHYHREHESDWGQDRITALLGPTGLPVVDDKTPPTSSIKLDGPRTFTSTLDMQLPDNWSAELPEAVHQQMAQVHVDTVFSLRGRDLHVERRTTVVSDKIPAKDWPEYHAWYDKAGAGSTPYVQLLPPAAGKSAGPVIAGVGTAPSSQTQPAAPAKPRTEAERLAEAKRLVESANAKLQRNDVDSAATDLEAAKALNENQQELWGDLGAVAFRHGNQTEAMKEYRKEVELYPQSDFAWRNMVSLQMRDNYKAAAATAREWVAAAPQQLEPRQWLISALWADNQNAAALEAAKAAKTELPGELAQGNGFQMTLGEAQMRGGDVAAGAETLSQLAQGNASALERNNAAYELAKAHQQMPLAESVERGVLKELEAETLTWTGNESVQTMRNASNTLTASWDTMGWILYLEGKFAEAEPYIHAASLYRADVEVGEHLGDVEMALHHDHQAHLAYIAAGRLAELAHTTNVASLAKKASAAAAAEQQHPVADKGPPINRQQLFFSAPSGQVTGSAQYHAVLTPDSIVSLKPVNGASTPAQEAFVRSSSRRSLFPPNESAALYGELYLNCSQGECNLRLEP